MDLVTIGHIIFDTRCYVKNFPERDKTSIMTDTHVYTSAGGSACNSAIVAARMGLETGIIGNIGTDERGMFLLRELHASQVETTGVNICPGESGLAIVIVDERGAVEVVESVGVADSIKKVHPHYIKNAKFLHMTGTNLDALEKASATAKKAGAQVSFDPGRSKSRLGHKKLAKIFKNTDYLIVNSLECEELTGIENVDKSTNLLSKTYGITSIIKSSSRPVKVRGPEKTDVPTFKVKAVDTIGAGDAFAAGFITARIEGKNLKDSAKFANAVAASEVMFRGTHTLLSRRQLEKKFKV
jgi:sugar/nucleoside kinase (ribokinase family)